MKKVDFNGYFVEMQKMKLRDANDVFPLVASCMLKIGLGNFDFFRDISKEQLELLQDKLCANSVKVLDSQGSKKGLSLSDLEECLEEVVPLLCQFLEYNFGFFSRAPRLLEKIIPQAFVS